MPIVKLRPLARADLRDIWQKGRQRWGDKAADDYIRAVHRTLVHYAGAPLTGSNRDFVMPALRKAAVGEHHAYYLPIAGGIDVVRILHPRMDVESAIGYDQ